MKSRRKQTRNHTLPKWHISLIVVLPVLMLFVGIFLARQTSERLSENTSRNSQVFYAEISTLTPSIRADATPPTDSVTVPILVYHIVRPSYPDDSREVRALAHTPEIFDAQLSHLIDSHYHFISFADLEKYFARDVPLPKKSIIISFDDGWRDQYEYAFPILKKYHISATFFVFTNPIGKKHAFLTWDNLREMQRAGMVIGSHTRSHPYLTQVYDPATLRDEIVGSKAVLEKELGTPITLFAYPFGQYNPAIVQMVEDAGYTSARGDYYSGDQSKAVLYTLNAMNTPVTMAAFTKLFP